MKCKKETIKSKRFLSPSFPPSLHSLPQDGSLVIVIRRTRLPQDRLAAHHAPIRDTLRVKDDLLVLEEGLGILELKEGGREGGREEG